MDARMWAILSTISVSWILHQLRFGAAGLVAIGVNYASLWALLALLGLGGLVAVCVAFVLSASVNFVLQKFWTFKVGGCIKRQLGAYCGMTAAMFVLNGVLFVALAPLWGTAAAEVVCTVAVNLAGYLLTTIIFTKLAPHAVRAHR